MIPRNSKTAISLLVLGALMSTNPVAAEDKANSLLDTIWSVPKLYSDPENNTLQSFALVGRYHGQYWSVDANQGNARDWENRRMIVGFTSKWFQDFTLQAQMYIATDESSYYDGIYEAYIKWAPKGKDMSLSVGRLDYLFTGLERRISSKEITAVERGMLVNQLMPAEVIGAHFKGKSGKLSYQGGLFGDNVEEEFGELNGGSAAVIGAGYDTNWFGLDGIVQIDYLYNGSDDNEDSNAFRLYRHVVSLWYKAERDRFGLGVDFTTAKEFSDNGRLWGITVLPTWVILDQVFADDDPLQLAFRYQYALSNDKDGLQPQRRYEQEVTSGNGDRYQAFYAGLNYYIYGNKLKLMFGAEFADMEADPDSGGEYRGWTLLGALRLYF